MNIEDLKLSKTDDTYKPDPQEEAAWEEANQVYSNLRSHYEALIDSEYDQRRRDILGALLADLNEENK